MTSLAAEWLLRKHPRWASYALILTGTLIAVEYALIQPHVDGLLMILVVPLLVSVFYFQWQKVFISYLLSLLSMAAVFTFNPHYDAGNSGGKSFLFLRC